MLAALLGLISVAASRAILMALPMSRRDIADYLGLTLETVSRTFSQLQSQGVLGLSGARRVALRDRQCLLGMDA